MFTEMLPGNALIKYATVEIYISAQLFCLRDPLFFSAPAG
jgi:hypothetical protein